MRGRRFINLLGGVQAVAPPVTTNFSASQASEGFFGYFDTASASPKREYCLKNSAGTLSNGSDWSGYVKGTSAQLRGGGIVDGGFDVSIDDGPWTNKTKISGTNADGVFQLFSGLADVPHLVRIKPNTAFSNLGVWTYESGNFLSVTGASPALSSLATVGTKWMITDSSFPGVHVHSVLARPSGANILPNNSDTANQAAQGNGGTIKIKAQCTDIWIFTGDTEAYYSVDGGAMQQATLGGPSGAFRAWRRIATGLDNTAAHVYLIACGSSVLSNPPPLGVMLGGTGSSYSAIPATKKVVQYGDSVTQVYNVYAGETAAVNAVYKTAAARGYASGACGVTGQVASGLDSSLATIRGYRNIVEDVAIVAIGRNDSGTTSSAFKTSVTSILNKLLTAGVGKIIVRGQNFGGSLGSAGIGGVAGRDQDLSDAVAALANANVVYVDVSTWTTITGVAPNTGAGDGTHPYLNVGNSQLSGYEAPAYAATGFV